MRRSVLLLALTAAAAFLAAGSLMLADPARAAFPGKNGRIAFVREALRGSDIYTVRPDGTRPANITKSPGVSDTDPAWSRDGGKIAFSRDGDIFWIEAGGGSPRRVTSGPAGDFSPSWSPDGERVAFVRQRGEGSAKAVCRSCIRTVKVDGTGMRRLTAIRGFSSDPAWSPDGGRIAFQRGLDIFVMDAADGGRKRNLTRTPRLQESEPDWSPDGGKIAFTSFTEAGGAFDRVFTMNADGTAREKLRDGVSSPAWSPNGRRIAFVEFAPPENADIFTMRTDGTDVRRVTGNPAFEVSPDWRPG